jgi:hypothetical protein
MIGFPLTRILVSWAFQWGLPTLRMYILNGNISVVESAHIAAVLDVFEVSTASIGFNPSKLEFITSPVNAFAGFFRFF